LQSPKEPLRARDVEYWLYLIHNLVNQKLDKKWQRQKEMVYDGRVREDEKGYMETLFDWIFILMMNYESLRPQDAKALYKVGHYAQEPVGKWLKQANQYDVTLGALLDRKVFDAIYEKDVCQGGTNNVALSPKRWKKSCWYVFHIAHLVRALRNSPVLRDKSRTALDRLNYHFVVMPHETLADPQEAFKCLHKVRCQWDPSCPSYEQTIARFESYKAKS